MLEVETKYRITDQSALTERLGSLGAIADDPEHHADTYYRHPCRDFVQTGEALRVRSVNSIAAVTYKGPKLDVGDSALKARKEIEWCLAPADTDGSQMHDLLTQLGFDPVATVKKERTSYHWPPSAPLYSQFTLTIDHVDEVGQFAEIELLIPEPSPQQVDRAGKMIDELAQQLGLDEAVRQSYLEMFLSNQAASDE